MLFGMLQVRIVYDASVKASRGVKSLNDCFYNRDPLTLPDSCGVLVRLHTYFIVILTICTVIFTCGIQIYKSITL